MSFQRGARKGVESTVGRGGDVQKRARHNRDYVCLEGILLGSCVAAPSVLHPRGSLGGLVSPYVYMMMIPGVRTLEKTLIPCLSWFSASCSFVLSLLPLLSFFLLVDGTLVHPGDQASNSSTRDINPPQR